MSDVVWAFNEVGRAMNFTTVRVRSSSWWSLIVVGRFPQGYPGEHMWHRSSRGRISMVPADGSESLTSSTYGLAAIRVTQTWAFVLGSPFAGGDAASILREAVGAVGDLASLQVAVKPRTVHNSEFAAEAAHKRRQIAIDQFH
jgi:hypothetical protein